jgi:transcriptional regulator with PAS, ATPase and Fis domain
LERYQLRHQLRILHSSPSFADLNNLDAFKEMIAESDAMVSVFHQAETASASHYNLIVSGETGTGKEMLSRIIHRISDRSQGPFVAVNMSASPASLFENSFFGHVKGAYTGAGDDKRGFFEEAHGGTLFLDEITELHLDLQAKLLRVIEEGAVYRLGSSRFKNVDVRIIAATNKDIDEQVRKGEFRKDLFYRLNVIRIHLPPLREHPQDIIPLAYHFLKRHAAYNRKDIHSISPALENLLLRHDYPGNVRELENIIASAVVVEEDSVLHRASVGRFSLPSGVSEASMMPLKEVEKQHISQVLEVCGGNKTRAAKVLGIGLRTLQRKLKVFEGT